MRKRWIQTGLAVLMLLLCSACAGPAPTGSGSSGPAGSEGEPDLEVKKLILVREPDRVEYTDGESFDPAGAVLNAQLEDGTVLENVPYEGIIVDEPLEKTTLFAKFVYGGQTAQVQLRVSARGNGEEYSVASTPEVPDSPLAGKVILWLGSSVTEGASSGKESMVDFLAKRDGAVCIKQAVSGTTLADFQSTSYVSRLNQYLSSGQAPERLDAFVCQLSTNDRNTPEHFGAVTPEEVRSAGDFDAATTFGAMEYIIATVRERWDCPIYFYTNPPFGDSNYTAMVEGLEEIAGKWGIVIIDLYRDEEFNSITAEELSLYMADSIHPTKAGYREWWLPRFEQALSSGL